ncbi:9158_t:CDS:10 [Acaulospora morrowiae]|uniref:9158_t:CDS:1 n=1 Tax=Acaulospora morrowiae TaxID=94023 RepID=A0A9N8ZS66_9GLOM|nr:9158_t:CDS:10 [Acaulospora morrowiae]
MNKITSLSQIKLETYKDANLLNSSAHPITVHSQVRERSQAMLSFWNNLWNPPKIEKYSIENLKRLSALLLEHSRRGNDDDYLLSNNYINQMICHKFDFSNEEILAYFIYLLRTLSFKLDTNTLYFFFNENIDDFPLYSEAIKFFNSDESMIRAAVRTITLNIFAVNDDQMQDFILDKKAAPYFSNLVYFIANHASILNDISNSSTYYKQYSRFNYYMAEHCDNFYYINDIINLDIEKMNQTLTAHLMDLLVQPIYADSLVKESLLPSKQKVRINSVVALALLCHVLHIFRHTPLVTSMVAMLFANSPSMMDYSHSPPTRFEYSGTWFRRNLYREAIMGFLVPSRPDDSDYYDLNTLPALCLLYMSCRNNAIAPDVLIATDVYPQKLLKTRRLMMQDTFVSDSEDDAPPSFDERRSFDTESTASTPSQAKPIYPGVIDPQLPSSSYKSVRGLFINEEDGESQYGSLPMPTIKISNDDYNHYGSQNTRNYRGELIKTILTLLCKYYHLCRPMTLQMATEVLLEMLYYNGSGECLTDDQIEMMNKAERDLQDRIRRFLSNGQDFPLEESEKAVSDAMFGGDKYVAEIIMSAKLLLPPPVVMDPEKRSDANIEPDMFKCIKTLYLIRKTRMLLSRRASTEVSNFDNDRQEANLGMDMEQELVYQKCVDNDKKSGVRQKSILDGEQFRQQQQIENIRNKLNTNTQAIPKNPEDLEKRKRMVFDTLGIQL